MALRRRRSFSSPRPRRKLVWVRTADGIVIPDDGTVGTQVRYPLTQFEGTYGANLIGCTVLRVRGVITAVLTGDTGITQSYAAVRFAMRVTDHADLNLGDYQEGALYGNQAQADWFLFEPFMLDNSTDITSGEEPETVTAGQIRMVDVKARRKVEEVDQTLELLCGRPVTTSTQPPANVGDVRVRWDLSILVALP